MIDLAEQFKGDDSPYIRANAIHAFLREKYAFFTPDPDRVRIERPEGHDPVDWFLFERRGGGSSSFSSAFVVLARAAGIPARVVAGWAIDTGPEPQTVFSDQNHQWAEIALEGIGWVTFDPTRADAFPVVEEERALPELMEELVEGEEPREREEAAEALGDLAEPEALPALVEAVENDVSVTVRLAAESAIHKIGVEELIWLLLNHENAEIREAAAKGLKVYGSPKSVDALRQALSADTDARVREASAAALGQIGGEAAEHGLLEAALADGEAAVREEAVLGLGRQRAAWTVEHLVGILQDDPDAGVRAAAAWALAEIGGGAALRPLLDARSGDPDAFVVAAAEEALANWRVFDLVDELLGADDPVWRAAAAEVLGERGDLGGVPALAQALNDSDATVRAAALDALKSIGDYDSLENGSGLLTVGGEIVGMVAGMSAFTGTVTPDRAVFVVVGARNTGYLRTGAGAAYDAGRWIPVRQTSVPYEEGGSPLPLAGVLPTVTAARSLQDTIQVISFGNDSTIPAGTVPTSKRLEQLDVAGAYWPESATFSIGFPVPSYEWLANVDEFSEAQLNAARRMTVSADSPYTQVPEWVLRGRIQALAVEITAGHVTPYAQAKAIERYLRTEYAYKLAETPEDAVPPEGQDPVDWFLFDKREGSCGNFSSAFVLLARSIGLPARVVSGWAIGQTPQWQTITADRAHQWAEVAFEGLGWVDFDPTPAGPQARAALDTLAGGEPDAIEDAVAALEEAGAEVSRLENGSSIVQDQDGDFSFGGGTTTGQVTQFPMGRLFKVAGAANTGYLRGATGDVYENGEWRQLDPVEVNVLLGSNVSDAVWNEYTGSDSQFRGLPFERRSNASLFGLIRLVGEGYTERFDEITLFPFNDEGEILPGIVPVSHDLQTVTLRGDYFPFSKTFRSTERTSAFAWTSRISSFSHQQLLNADAARDPTYLQLPPDLPSRIRERALQVTASHRTPYAKAKALERYLSSNFPYRLADGPEDAVPPGRDPVDWFLFDHREGTCGVFSSVFVVMARSIGIPARVVSGFVIDQTPEIQTVHAWQAHQWAEVALEGLGWITFEPTAPGAAPTRLAEEDDEVPIVPVRPLDTVTTISVWPTEVRRQQPFTVSGTVLTASGHAVDGMEVEIYVNETKEHGGTKLGTAVTSLGRWSAEVSMSRETARGPYQLLARAVGNDHFVESWSDPDIAVFSGSGIELTGPARVPVDGEAVFSGRLSEETGQGVEGRQLSLTVDGIMEEAITTGEFGRFTFGITFTEPGPHWVAVELAEHDYLLGNSARIDFEVTLPTLTTLETPAAVQVGEAFSVTGALHGVRGEPLANRSLDVSIGEGQARPVTTDAAGAFALTATLDSPGAFTVRAEFGGDGPILASEASAGMAVQEASVLTLEGPGSIELGNGATFTGRLTTAADSPLGQTALSIVDADGAEVTVVTTGDDGVFEYQHAAFFETGPQSLSAQYPGADFVVPSLARVAFTVLAPTFLSLETPDIVQDGENYTLQGLLRDVNGKPVADATIAVTGQGDRTLTTDADGNFNWESLAVFDGGAEGSPYESPRSVEAAFAGTDHLAPSSAATDFVIGVPRVLLDPLGSVARGDAVDLRGTVLLGNRPLAGFELTVDGSGGLRADDDGSFEHRIAVPADAPLGARDVTVAVTDLGVSASVPLVVKSAVNITVTPLDTVRPGELVLLEVTLLDDRWDGIRGATLRTADGVQLVTGARGVTLLELTPPEGEDALTAPVTFTFEGDDLHMPLTYFIGIPVTPLGFNWLLWVGAPAVVVALAAAGYAGRRMNLASLTVLGRRRVAEGGPDTDAMVDADALEMEETPEFRVPVTLEIDFARPAGDLPDVWGVGEEIAATVTAVEEEGQAVGGAVIVATVTGEDTVELETGDDGVCAIRWVTSESGEYTVSAQFSGDEDRLPASASRTLRVVVFREEIVRLYNDFLDWARVRTGEDLGQATPREVELLLVTRGVLVSQKSLDELISRFEEADYSEHPIARRHFESMYRAWREVMGE